MKNAVILVTIYAWLTVTAPFWLAGAQWPFRVSDRLNRVKP